ncbi:MAG: hypothetical protein KAI66_18495, partial [Lentisphaeria bacterium]|nr:hypothetical protein [Lentisphaeria bacterium]
MNRKSIFKLRIPYLPQRAQRPQRQELVRAEEENREFDRIDRIDKMGHPEKGFGAEACRDFYPVDPVDPVRVK